MNRGNFGLNRTGHGGGAGREANYSVARNYYKNFLQSVQQAKQEQLQEDTIN
jgi:hypothetical protein